MERSGYWDRITRQRASRRALLSRLGYGMAGVTGLALVGCSSSSTNNPPSGAPARVASATSAAASPGSPTAAAAFPVSGSTVAAKPVKGGTLRFADAGLPKFLSPRGAQGGNSLEYHTLVGDPYIYVKADGSFDPALSLWEKWEQPDHTTIRATLRKGVTFHDGTPFTSAVVKQHLEYMNVAKNVPNYGFFSFLSNFAGVDTPDDNTVVLHSKQPDASFLSIFSTVAGVPFSFQQIQKLGEDEYTKPACTGPYMVDSYTSTEGGTLVKNPSYWGRPDGTPTFDKIQYAGPVDQKVRANGQEGGDFDATWYINSDENSLRLSKNSSFQQKQLSVAPLTLEFNWAKPPLDNLKVRQAIASSLDRAKVLALVYQGQGRVAQTGLLPPRTLGAFEYEKYPFDLKAAKQYLDASGVPASVKLSYIYGGAGTAETLNSAQIYQESMKQIGIELDIQSDPSTSLATNRYLNGEIHMQLGSTGVRPDPSNSYLLYVSSSGSLNVGGQKTADPLQKQLDALIDKSMTEFDPTARVQIFHDVQRFMVDNVISRIQISDRIRWLIANQKVGGMVNPEVVTAPGGAGFRLQFLWLKS